MKTKKTVSPWAAVLPPQPMTDYERGMTDALDLLVTITDEMHDRLRPAVMSGSPDAASFFLGGVASSGQNLLGAVRAELEKRVIRTLIASRDQPRGS